MDAEKLGRSRFLNLFFKPAGATMKSRLRQWLFDPRETLRGAGLKNVEVVRRDALNTELEAASVDLVLLFGVVPYPTLPLGRLLPEMHRVLKADGTLAVWLFPISFGVPKALPNPGQVPQKNQGRNVCSPRRMSNLGL